MMFIKLTYYYDDTPLWVNAMHIMSMVSVLDDNGEHTKIYMAAEAVCRVKESIPNIIILIDQAKRGGQK